jgi:hypothetical protein
MSFSPPNTFVDGTTVTSADLEGNYQALRVYLHGGIVAGDIENVQWIDTRHIQPPVYEPFSQVQHGISGHQGGSDSGLVRLTFCTKYLSGGGRTSSNAFHPIPQTAITVDARRACTMLFHYWWEVEAGPDESTGAGQNSTKAERKVWIAPYVGTPDTAYSQYRMHAQEAANNINVNTGTNGWDGSVVSALRPYTIQGAYQSRDGTFMYEAPNGITTFGLAAHSQIDRVAVVNWGVSIETFYL